MPALLAPTIDDETTVVDQPYRYTTSTVVVEEPTTWDWHRHADAELLWVVRGRVDVWTPTLAWTAVPGLALAIAPEERHRVRTTGPASLFCTYARATDWPTQVVRLDEATRGLLLHLAERDMPDDERGRAEAVVADLLARGPVGPVDVPVPRHPAARTVAERLLADPADVRSLADWAAALATSERTLARAFTAEAGAPFGRWRADVRIRHATTLLGGGVPVAGVAERVGYASVPAFCAAYLRATGRTPGGLTRNLTRRTPASGRTSPAPTAG